MWPVWRYAVCIVQFKKSCDINIKWNMSTILFSGYRKIWKFNVKKCSEYESCSLCIKRYKVYIKCIHMINILQIFRILKSYNIMNFHLSWEIKYEMANTEISWVGRPTKIAAALLSKQLWLSRYCASHCILHWVIQEKFICCSAMTIVAFLLWHCVTLCDTAWHCVTLCDTV